MTEVNSSVEKIWVTKAGLAACIIKTRGRFYCGYVGVPKDHPLAGLHYNNNSTFLKDVTGEEGLGQRSPLIAFIAAGNETSPCVAFDVHGGITFSGEWKESSHVDGSAELDSSLWYFGYDCNHYEDGQFELHDAEGKLIYNYSASHFAPKSLDFNIQQCESLARQIVDKTLPRIGE